MIIAPKTTSQFAILAAEIDKASGPFNRPTIALVNTGESNDKAQTLPGVAAAYTNPDNDPGEGYVRIAHKYGNIDWPFDNAFDTDSGLIDQNGTVSLTVKEAVALSGITKILNSVDGIQVAPDGTVFEIWVELEDNTGDTMIRLWRNGDTEEIEADAYTM